MARSAPLRKAAAEEYLKWINLVARPATGRPAAPWPGLSYLLNFINREHESCLDPSTVSIIDIPGEASADGAPSASTPDISIPPPIKDHATLSEKIPALADTTGSSQLVIVENIDPETLLLLGGTYAIDPQFFAEHVNVVPWHKPVGKISERLPALPSTRKAEDFLTLRYVTARELSAISDDSGSILWPDRRSLWVHHSAWKLRPLSRPLPTGGLNFPTLAFARQTVSVWCRKKLNEKGWIAILLVDPPFRPKLEQGRVGQAEYRSPELRPKMHEKFHSDGYKHSFRRAFCHLLEQRCHADKRYLRACALDVFLALHEGYRVAASEWVLLHEYVKRELSNIEWRLEKTEPTFQELELRLKDLYSIRRRCNKYSELVTEASLQCKSQGQASWPCSDASSGGMASAAALAERHARELELDFQFVQDNMKIIISRIEKNITLLTTLVTIAEGRQGLTENKVIALLGLIATVFLPSQAVATVLGLQTRFGPEADDFWVLWAVALPLTALVVAIPFMYPTGSTAVKKLAEKCFRSWSKVTRGMRWSKEDDLDPQGERKDVVYWTSVVHEASCKA